MNRAEKILILGLAALSSLFLPACGTTVSGPELAELSPLVASSVVLHSVSYLADYSQDGALPFTCEVRMRSDGSIRRDYVWKDENDAEKKVSIVISDRGAVRIEDGKAVAIDDSDTEMTRFFAGLVFAPDRIVSSADESVRTAPDGGPVYVYGVRLNGVPGVETCVLNVDPGSRLWTGLLVRMKSGMETVSSFSAYETFAGVTYPSRIVSSTGDGGAPALCIIRDVKINPELPDELFQFSDTNG